MGEKLDKVYWCTACKSVFLFSSDVKDHKNMFGHSEIRQILLD